MAKKSSKHSKKHITSTERVCGVIKNALKTSVGKTIKCIAEDTGYSTRTVIKYLKILEEVGQAHFHEDHCQLWFGCTAGRRTSFVPPLKETPLGSS
jgi:response regulator of citrate/malate metabolism